MPTTQTDRLIAITTPLGDDALLLRSFEGVESVSSLFEFSLGLLSEDDAIDFTRVVGSKATVQIADASGEVRFWNGYISRFWQERRETILTAYTAQLVPWLWFLTLKTDSRIFQDMNTRDIVTDVFSRAHFQDFEWRTEGALRNREYCVQYQETDFAFVSRLLEDEGISYFFEHDRDKHVLVLGDQPGAHRDCAGQPSARYATSKSGYLPDDRVTAWKAGRAFCTSGVALADFNFTTPDTDLRVSVEGDNPFQWYQYPGGYANQSEGQALVDRRIEEMGSGVTTIEGDSSCRAFRAGSRFVLGEHYRRDFNQAYVLTRLRHKAVEGGYDVGVGRSAADGSSYSNEFTCIPASTAFRPERRTRRRLVEGCQTATVVGPQGEEIFTDKYGRVKVQFHWDRIGQRNERSSCWIRVAQAWAGDRWGAIAIPRIGQEVVVDFLEGNPDRPLIVGTVYNDAQMPPYDLPAGGDMTGIRSNTTKGGVGYNEIVLKDAKSEELIRVHAQRDMHTTVRHDQREAIKNSKHLHVSDELRVQVDKKISRILNGDVAERFAVNHAEVVAKERYLKAKRIILEADQEICLRVGGNHVHISSGGVFIEGKMVDVNCGHPAIDTSIDGLTPESPEEPE